jgi:hypothetical protein
LSTAANQILLRATQAPILNVQVTGLSDAMEKFKDNSTALPKVKAQIELTDSGVLGINEVTALFDTEQKVESPSLKGIYFHQVRVLNQIFNTIVDTVLNFFKGGKKDANAEGDGAEVCVNFRCIFDYI